MRSIAPVVALAGFLASASARTLLANGTTMLYGTIASGAKWQASGQLWGAGCTGAQAISDCYELDLVSDPNSELDPNFLSSPRQRIEFRSPENAAAGTSWTFTWKSYYAPETSGDNYFHIMQLFSTSDNNPLYTLDFYKSQAALRNYVSGSSATGNGDTLLASIPATSFFNRTLINTVSVTWGPSGSMSYAAKDAKTGASVISGSATSYMGSTGGYLKFGTYRKTWTGMGASQAWVGDYTEVQNTQAKSKSKSKKL